jgi:enolase-phosphatase E1
MLLDIEGTTTPIDFVYRTLFPYARARLKGFLVDTISNEETRADITGLLKEHAEDVRQGLGPPPLRERPEEARLESIASYAGWLMDSDRKSTPLKSLQGKIWEAGYLAGELRAEVFDDVPRAFARWRRQQVDICIYSSGSVLAQRLLFSRTAAGDLTAFIRDFFDTNTGAKREAGSYRRISASLGLAPPEITFISDSVAELDAAQEAGMPVFLCVRPGNHPQPDSPHSVVETFDSVSP